MGYDLLPKNKNTQGISVGAFSWPMYLQESGAGYVLGYGAGIRPATYVYQSGKKGSPVSNDGYYVTSKEAKIMSCVIDGYLSVQRFMRLEIDALSQEKVNEMEEANKNFSWKTYNMPMAGKHLDKLDEISKFMKESGGFHIR